MEGDLEALDRYLDSDLAPGACMGLSDIDGFLTAIVIGPELIPPSEWLPVVWGGDEPEFKSDGQMRMILGAIMNRYNEIIAGLKTDPEKFKPIYLGRQTGEPIVGDWVAGFLDAVNMRRKAWEPLLNHRRAKTLMEPLLILGGEGDFDSVRGAADRWKEFYAARPDVIPTCVKGIYNFWLDYHDRGKPQARRIRRTSR